MSASGYAVIAPEYIETMTILILLLSQVVSHNLLIHTSCKPSKSCLYTKQVGSREDPTLPELKWAITKLLIAKILW